MPDDVTLRVLPGLGAPGHSAAVGEGATRPPVSSLWRLVSRRNSAIATFNAKGDLPPFYCVHPVSGGVTSFSPLASRLPAGQPFYGIQVPRNQTNAAFASSIESIARHHVHALTTFQPEGPIVIGGWSAGAIVALEVAQQLRAIGRDVPLLVALDGAPANTGAGLKPWHPLYAWQLLLNLPAWFQQQRLLNETVSACLHTILRKLAFRVNIATRPKATAQTLDAESVNDLLDSKHFSDGHKAFIGAFYDAMLAYRPQPYAGAVLVFEAKVQPIFHLLQVGAAWRTIATDIEVVSIRSNHETLFREPALTVLADYLGERLGQLDV